jgi:hypothetical protein
MNNDLEVLEKESIQKEFTIQGRKILIGKLSFIQVTKGMKALAKIFLKDSARFSQLKADGANNKEDIISIIDKFDETELLEFISIITKQDKEFCAELGLKEVSDILETVIEFNLQDIQDILKNWQRTVSKFKSEQKA